MSHALSLQVSRLFHIIKIEFYDPQQGWERAKLVSSSLSFLLSTHPSGLPVFCCLSHFVTRQRSVRRVIHQTLKGINIIIIMTINSFIDTNLIHNFLYKLYKIKFLYMFRASSAHLQEVNDVNPQVTNVIYIYIWSTYS